MASPLPGRIVQIETLRLLVEAGVVVICVGGGGNPVIHDDGDLVGLEAIIDKDRASVPLAAERGADALLMLTDVDAVYEDVEPAATSDQACSAAGDRSRSFSRGSMGPKAKAARAFASQPGRIAGIGRLEDAVAVLEGRAGTIFSAEV